MSFGRSEIDHIPRDFDRSDSHAFGCCKLLAQGQFHDEGGVIGRQPCLLLPRLPLDDARIAERKTHALIAGGKAEQAHRRKIWKSLIHPAPGFSPVDGTKHAGPGGDGGFLFIRRRHGEIPEVSADDGGIAIGRQVIPTGSAVFRGVNKFRESVHTRRADPRDACLGVDLGKPPRYRRSGKSGRGPGSRLPGLKVRRFERHSGSGSYHQFGTIRRVPNTVHRTRGQTGEGPIDERISDSAPVALNLGRNRTRGDDCGYQNTDCG